MTKLSHQPFIATLFCLLSLAIGCSNRLDNQSGGIEGTGDTMASRGVVTRLGSIYVNGVHFETADAEIYVDGEQATEHAIEPGMVVTVYAKPGASSAEAVANKVTVERLVSGDIRDIGISDDDMLTLKVPGYTVLVPEDANFSGTNYDSLSLGNTISVSGLEVDESTIYASQITALPDAQYIFIRGRIRNLDDQAQRFAINDMTIDYQMAILTNADSSSQGLEPGQYVSVKGHQTTMDSNLVAESVSILSPFNYRDGLAITEEGFVSDYQSEYSFKVNGVSVDASQTAVTGGELSDLRNRVRVSVRGRYRNGVLLAQTLHMILPSEIRTSGQIDDINPIRRTLTVEDMEFQTTPFTLFDNGDFSTDRYFDLHDLRVGNSVEIYARKMNENWIVITLRRTMEKQFPFSIKGAISGYNPDGNFYLNDLLVLVDNLPSEYYQPFPVGQEVFVTGTMIDHKVLQADGVFPSISGCSHWMSEECRPLPPFFPKDDDPNWEWRPHP